MYDKKEKCICRDLTKLTDDDRKSLGELTSYEVFLSLMASVLYTDSLHEDSPPSYALRAISA